MAIELISDEEKEKVDQKLIAVETEPMKSNIPEVDNEWS